MRLVDDARHAWRWWSVRLAALAGVAAGALVANPQILTGLVDYVPAPYRPQASALVGLLVFVAPTVARILQQGSKSDGSTP